MADCRIFHARLDTEIRPYTPDGHVAKRHGVFKPTNPFSADATRRSTSSDQRGGDEEQETIDQTIRQRAGQQLPTPLEQDGMDAALRQRAAQ